VSRYFLPLLVYQGGLLCGAVAARLDVVVYSFPSLDSGFPPGGGGGGGEDAARYMFYAYVQDVSTDTFAGFILTVLSFRGWTDSSLSFDPDCFSHVLCTFSTAFGRHFLPFIMLGRTRRRGKGGGECFLAHYAELARDSHCCDIE
jgi:hypothetical protein